MKYKSVKTASFISRPNRFLARVMTAGREEVVHVKTTGRCREILTEGTGVILEEAEGTGRKTRYSLISAYKGEMLINIDSQVPNAVVYQSILEGDIAELPEVTKLSREVTYGSSRFDLYFEAGAQKGFIEVKGVTLEAEGVALFPDAPTQRGTRHIYEMIHAVEEGYAGYLFFLIQLKGVTRFTPNWRQDPDFAKALSLAQAKGVTLLAYDSIITKDEIRLGAPVEICL